MERWIKKTAVVTGASAGIGAAICVSLADSGLRVVGLARRPELIEKLQSVVTGSGSIQSRRCDVSDKDDIAATFKWVEETVGGVDVLVNNAGVHYEGNITDVGNKKLSDEDILSTIDINIKGLILCTRFAIATMKKHNLSGHVININSVAGHYIPFSPNFNVYPSTKYAVSAFNSSLMNELAHFQSKIKLTSISPGLVNTSMGTKNPSVAKMPMLQPQDVADAVVYALSTPPHVNINELTITSVTEKLL